MYKKKKQIRITPTVEDRYMHTKIHLRRHSEEGGRGASDGVEEEQMAAQDVGPRILKRASATAGGDREVSSW